MSRRQPLPTRRHKVNFVTQYSCEISDRSGRGINPPPKRFLRNSRGPVLRFKRLKAHPNQLAFAGAGAPSWSTDKTVPAEGSRPDKTGKNNDLHSRLDVHRLNARMSGRAEGLRVNTCLFVYLTKTSQLIFPSTN